MNMYIRRLAAAGDIHFPGFLPRESRAEISALPSGILVYDPAYDSHIPPVQDRGRFLSVQIAT